MLNDIFSIFIEKVTFEIKTRKKCSIKLKKYYLCVITYNYVELNDIIYLIIFYI